MFAIRSIQSRLSFGGSTNPQFSDRTGLGRVGVAGYLLGLTSGIGIALVTFHLFMNGFGQSSIPLQFGIYLVALAFFHFMEFLSTALFKPSSLTYDSYVINHSEAYTLALLMCLFEYLIEALLFKSSKTDGRIVLAGLILIVTGQILRIAAMWTCGKNFSHVIMMEKRDNHELVTTGVYSLFRHPSYTGWYWWSLGTQVLLANPICAIWYACVGWIFFSERIPYEENLLTEFYPDTYPSYARKTFIGIPFVRTYVRNSNKSR
mmetsp:Transcript_15535/g.23143  ORF Transcript_15535/g.23143 Transcript_15535/m.23143 type:complete len:262 (+) Transcript_15535:117-902(+)